MKLFTITILITTLISCSEKKSKTEVVNSKNDAIPRIETIKKTEVKIDTVTTIKKVDSISKDKGIANKKDGIPPDGSYVYDIAYAEWQGRSMGEKVKVIIKGNTVKVIAKGHSSVGVENGEIIDEGILRKHHKTGDWLISSNPSDVNLETYGGCAGAPMVIDFINKVYVTC